MATGRTRSKIFHSRGEMIINPQALDDSVPATELRLGFTESGLEIDFGDFAFLEPNEESGRGPGVAFFAGQDIRMRFVLREWKDETLQARFPSQNVLDAPGHRIEIPGNLAPGDSLLDESVSLLFRPDDATKDPYIWAAKAVLVAAQPTVIGTTRSRVLSVEYQLYPDDTLIGQAQEDYRTLVIGTAAQITLP